MIEFRRPVLILLFWLLLPSTGRADAVDEIRESLDGLRVQARELQEQLRSLREEEREAAREARRLKSQYVERATLVRGMALRSALGDLRSKARRRVDLLNSLRRVRAGIETQQQLLYEALLERVRSAIRKGDDPERILPSLDEAQNLRRKLHRIEVRNAPSLLPTQPVARSPQALRALANIYLNEAGLLTEDVKRLDDLEILLEREAELLVNWKHPAAASRREEVERALRDVQAALVRDRRRETQLKKRGMALRREAMRMERRWLQGEKERADH